MSDPGNARGHAYRNGPVMGAPGYRNPGREPWASMPSLEMIDRLEAIGAYHRAEVGEGECAACGHPWPCLTHKMACGSYLLEDGTE